MNGIIVVNKEKGMTSHDVVNKIRKIFKTKQVSFLLNRNLKLTYY